MLHRSRIRLWYLSFNPHAKARPNFGLKGVGIFQPDCPKHYFISTPLIAAIYFIACCTLYVVKTSHIEQYIEENAGGGPQLMITPQMQAALKAKPWEFKFLPGEGYANKPKYKETGVSLDYLDEIDLRKKAP